MQTGIIVNPYAGRAGGLPPAPTTGRGLAREALASCGVGGEVAFTGRRGTARALARSLVEAGATSLVCWGGDGTVNEVASEAARHGLPLGIVPGGSGNGLARELGLERQPEAALRTALRGPERILDAGEIDGRFFANVAGVGFDAHVARLAESSSAGAVVYFAAGIPELLAYRPSTYRIRTGEDTFGVDALLVTIANGRQYGNGAVIAPRARPDDGRLDLVCVPALPTAVLFWQARRLFTGTVDRVRGVRTVPIDDAEVSGDGPPRVPRRRRGVHGGPEPAGADPPPRPAGTRPRPGRPAVTPPGSLRRERAPGGVYGAPAAPGAPPGPGRRIAYAGSPMASKRSMTSNAARRTGPRPGT